MLKKNNNKNTIQMNLIFDRNLFGENTITYYCIIENKEITEKVRLFNFQTIENFRKEYLIKCLNRAKELLHTRTHIARTDGYNYQATLFFRRMQKYYDNKELKKINILNNSDNIKEFASFININLYDNIKKEHLHTDFIKYRYITAPFFDKFEKLLNSYILSSYEKTKEVEYFGSAVE